MSTERPGHEGDPNSEESYLLAKAALARAKDTARNRGFRTRTGGRRKTPHPNVTPGRGRDPAEVTSTVDRLIAMMGWRGRITISSVLSQWEEIVGADIAAHCQPEKFTDGELTIRTDSTTWATQLRYLLPKIERRLAQEVGEGMVTAIHIQGPSRRRMAGKWRVQGRGPRDTWG